MLTPKNCKNGDFRLKLGSKTAKFGFALKSNLAGALNFDFIKILCVGTVCHWFGVGDYFKSIIYIEKKFIFRKYLKTSIALANPRFASKHKCELKFFLRNIVNINFFCLLIK